MMYEGTKSQTKKWFDVDAQWARDYIQLLRGVQEFTPHVVYDALDGFVKLCDMASKGTDESGTLDASIGNLLLYEDTLYMKTIGDLERVAMSPETTKLEHIRKTIWPESSNPLVSPTLPYPIPLISDMTGTDVSVFNADVIWTNDFMSRGMGIFVSRPLEIAPYASSVGVMLIGSVMVLERYRIALARQDDIDKQFIEALRIADGQWWNNIYAHTKWEKCGIVANKMLGAHCR